jgi:inorganic triphosphatase YgiF
MADPLEVELKLEVDPADRDRLAAARPFGNTEGTVEHLVARYFDTPRRDVREAGYSLRVRREGAARVQTVKANSAAAGLFERVEWEREVDADTPVLNAQSGPLLQLLGPAAFEHLDRLFVTDVRRTARTIDLAGNRFECAIDDGEVRAGRRKLPLCELELELESGSPQSLFDFARKLDEEVPLRLSVVSKAERGYRLIEGVADQPAKAEMITLDPDGDTGDGFQTIARSCVRQFRLNETMLLTSGAPEPLHQARVGLRRLRTALSLHRSLFAADARATLFDAELRWLAAELGEVRNLDVLAARADRKLRDRLGVTRERIFAHVRTELASARTRLLIIDLAEWLALGDWRACPHDPALLHRNVVAFAEEVLDKQLRQLKRRAKALATLDDAHRHKARIAAKKLRYAAQFFASLYRGEKARRRHKTFLEALEALQDHLGELNDLVIGPKVLAGLGIDAKPPGAGKHERGQLLCRAEEAYDALIDAKRFWR